MGNQLLNEEIKRQPSRSFFLRDPQNIACLSFTFMTILIFAALMILPRWIPRENPEGVYDARILWMNCMCDDGRAFLVVTNHQTCHAVMSHPGGDFILLDGIWEKNTDNGTLVFTIKNEVGESSSYQAECYWGGLEWTVETVKIKGSYWFPRLISEVCCDYFNKSFWLKGVLIACCIITAGNIILACTIKRT